MGRIRGVSLRNPCLVCGSTDGCGEHEDGRLYCRKRKGNQPGFRWLCESKRQPEWHIYRRETDPVSSPQTLSQSDAPTISTVFPSPSHARKTPSDWGKEARKYRGFLTKRRAEALAEELRLPLQALDALPFLGSCPLANWWTFPEMTANGQVCGILRRWRGGQKGLIPGSERGLTIPAFWQELPGSIRVVEGASDVLALSWHGLPTIGRPFKTGGGDLLSQLLLPTLKPIIVVGENDRAHDGSWPGKEGAESIADYLRERMPDRDIQVKFPPDGFKDARAWVIGREA